MIRRFDFPFNKSSDDESGDSESPFPDELITQHEDITLIEDCANRSK